MEKRIITWKAGNAVYARGFIFGNYGWSAADYQALVDEAMRDFPHLTPKDIDISKVTESTYMKDFKVVSFALPPATIHAAYSQWARFDFRY